MTYGLNDFRGMTAKQVAAKYDAARAFVLALPNCKFRDAAQFDEFLAGFNRNETGLRRAKGMLMSALNQVELHMTVTTFVPPSPETLAWGGLLGGDWHHDHSAVEAALAKVMG